MSQAIYLDCHAGIAGDMILAGLIDLGANPNYITEELSKLPLDTFDLSFNHVNKQGINAQHLSINIEESHHHRTAQHIFSMIENSTLPQRVKSRSTAIFNVIAEAEAKIHGMTVADVHFHEVGAMDSIIDIIGSCLALEDLNVDNIYCSPIPTGHGKVNIAHGLYPVPAPATAEILKGIPLASLDVASEMTTPTGAGFAKSLATQFGPLPPCTMTEIGYGAGTKDFDFPNVLRIIQFEENQNTQDYVQVLETQLDDMPAEMLGHFIEDALSQGALDVYYTPITMKKSRPAVQLSVICPLSKASFFENYILRQTSSLGVRSYSVRRTILDRDFTTINTDYGKVSIKLGILNGEVIKAKPEFSDLQAIADRTQLPLQQIYHHVMSQIDNLN